MHFSWSKWSNTHTICWNQDVLGDRLHRINSLALSCLSSMFILDANNSIFVRSIVEQFHYKWHFGTSQYLVSRISQNGCKCQQIRWKFVCLRNLSTGLYPHAAACLSDSVALYGVQSFCLRRILIHTQLTESYVYPKLALKQVLSTLFITKVAHHKTSLPRLTPLTNFYCSFQNFILLFLVTHKSLIQTSTRKELTSTKQYYYN